MNRLSVKSTVISRMRFRVEKRTSQIRKRLAGRMASLALQGRRCAGSICVRPANDPAGVRSDGCRILIALGYNGFQSAETQYSTKEYPGQDESDSKITSHGLDSFSGTATEKYPRCRFRASVRLASEVFKLSRKISGEIKLWQAHFARHSRAESPSHNPIHSLMDFIYATRALA